MAMVQPKTAKGKAHLAALKARSSTASSALPPGVLSQGAIQKLASQVAAAQTQPTIDAASSAIQTYQGMDRYQSGELAGAQGQATGLLKDLVANAGARAGTNATALQSIGQGAQQTINQRGGDALAAKVAGDTARGINDTTGQQQLVDRYAQQATDAAGRAQTAQTLGQNLSTSGQNLLTGIAATTGAQYPQQLSQLHAGFNQKIGTENAAIASAKNNQGNLYATTLAQFQQQNFANEATVATIAGNDSKRQLDYLLGLKKLQTSASNNAATNLTSANNNAATNLTSANNNAANNTTAGLSLAERKRHDQALEGTAAGRLELSRQQFTNKLDSGGKLTPAQRLALTNANVKLRNLIGTSADYVSNQIGKPKIVTTVDSKGKAVRQQKKFDLTDVRNYLDKKLQNPAAVQAALDYAGLSPGVPKGTIAPATAAGLKKSHIGVPSAWYLPGPGAPPTKTAQNSA